MTCRTSNLSRGVACRTGTWKISHPLGMYSQAPAPNSSPRQFVLDTVGCWLHSLMFEAAISHPPAFAVFKQFATVRFETWQKVTALLFTTFKHGMGAFPCRERNAVIARRISGAPYQPCIHFNWLPVSSEAETRFPRAACIPPCTRNGIVYLCLVTGCTPDGADRTERNAHRCSKMQTNDQGLRIIWFVLERVSPIEVTRTAA